MNYNKLAVKSGAIVLLLTLNIYMRYNDYPILPIAMVSLALGSLGGTMIAEVIKNKRK